MTNPDFDSVEEAVASFAAGNFVVVVDDTDRENEGDLLIAAEDATEEKIAFMVRHTSGMICVSMTGEMLDSLELPLMVENNTDSMRTAYTITVDYKHGTTTGISAHDRALTLRALAKSRNPSDFNRPGHVFPLRARDNGTLDRGGHTEAGVDLCRLAGKRRAAALAEVVLDNGKMARRDDLVNLSKEWNLKMISIRDLKAYRIANGLINATD